MTLCRPTAAKPVVRSNEAPLQRGERNNVGHVFQIDHWMASMSQKWNAALTDSSNPLSLKSPAGYPVFSSYYYFFFFFLVLFPKNDVMTRLFPLSVSVNSHFEELMRRSPYEKSIGGVNSHHSSFHSSALSPHLSSGSPSGSSPFSKHSTSKRGENEYFPNYFL